jgi:hypothetical protein
MSKKSTVGNAYNRGLKEIDRLIRAIDRREANGKNKENTDDVFRNHSFTKEGDRVWSF